jgi:hypothetical protein
MIAVFRRISKPQALGLWFWAVMIKIFAGLKIIQPLPIYS